MDEALIRERIAATLEQGFAGGAHVQECTEVPGVAQRGKSIGWWSRRRPATL